MRFSAIIPILISAAAFVLSILVVLAGRDPNFLTDTYIIKLDTSNIGNGNINIPNTGIAVIDNAIDNAPDGIVGKVVQTAAKVLGIHDFYTAQVMGYCEGNGGDGSPSVVTNCTSGPMFTFNPVAIMQDELRIAGGIVTLEDLGFPTGDVNNALRALNAVYQAMFVAYCIGIATAGLCIILGFLGFVPSRLMACVNWLVAFFSFLALSVASTIGTVLAVQLRNIINSKLSDIGITASYSSMYLGMTWAAVGAMLVVTLFWCGSCCTSRKEKNRSSVDRSINDRSINDESSLVDEKQFERKWWRKRRSSGLNNQ